MILDGLRAIDFKKIEAYLLNPKHPTGGAKARFFESFGFGSDDLVAFEMALLRHPLDNKVNSVSSTPFGTKSVVICNIHTPDGRNPCIVSVWVKEPGSAAQRFVTAYPAS